MALLFAACGQHSTETTPPEEAAAPAMSSGKRLFINNCVQCHAIKSDKIGPKLEGVLGRWNNDTARIITYVKNSQAMITEGKDARLTKLYKDYNQTQMPPFPNLTDDEIRDILGYIAKDVE